MFADKLKFLRHEHNITQSQLAKELDIGTSTIGMYESGIRKPSYNVLKKISDYFSVPIDYLVSETLYDELINEDFYIERFNELSPSEKKQVRDLVEFLIDKYHK